MLPTSTTRNPSLVAISSMVFTCWGTLSPGEIGPTANLMESSLGPWNSGPDLNEAPAIINQGAAALESNIWRLRFSDKRSSMPGDLQPSGMTTSNPRRLLRYFTSPVYLGLTVAGSEECKLGRSRKRPFLRRPRRLQFGSEVERTGRTPIDRPAMGCSRCSIYQEAGF